MPPLFPPQKNFAYHGASCSVCAGLMPGQSASWVPLPGRADRMGYFLTSPAPGSHSQAVLVGCTYIVLYVSLLLAFGRVVGRLLQCSSSFSRSYCLCRPCEEASPGCSCHERITWARPREIRVPNRLGHAKSLISCNVIPWNKTKMKSHFFLFVCFNHCFLLTFPDAFCGVP